MFCFVLHFKMITLYKASAGFIGSTNSTTDNERERERERECYTSSGNFCARYKRRGCKIHLHSKFHIQQLVRKGISIDLREFAAKPAATHYPSLYSSSELLQTLRYFHGVRM
jgi:hypothetical protein